MQPKICVLMCTYNGEDFLQEQIDSILNQSNVEVMLNIRDDGSTDRTLSILESYEEKINWYQDQHLSVNKGFIKLAKEAPDTEYYAFSDQDDVWLPDKLDRAISFLKNTDNKKPAMYACGQIVVDENLEFMFQHNMNPNRSKDDFFAKNSFSGNTIVFNRKLFELLKMANLSVDPEQVKHDRFLTRICIACGGDVIVDTENYIKYRQHGSNVVGVRHGFKEVIFQIKQYLFDVKFVAEFKNLLADYSENLLPHYYDVCNYAVKYRHNFFKRILFFNKIKMIFNDKKIGFLFHLKILLGLN